MVLFYLLPFLLSAILLALAFVLGRSRFGTGGVCGLATDRIRMVGSVRAAKDCLDCHSVDRGHLLGAFTYELVPEQPRGKRPAEPSARPPAAPL
jgi:hypothetical protein